MRLQLTALAILLAFVAITGCKHDDYNPKEVTPTSADGNFPPEVAKILITKCATAGCHNAQSYKNAGGLLLDTWEHLLDGGANGAAVVAYNTENSPLLYFINPDASVTHDVAATPTMPYNGAPLSINEYNTIKNWIKAGAPDKSGNIPFASNAGTHRKTYITQQGCDLVAVVDAEKKVVMRYIPIGTEPGIESAHCIRVSKDGRYAYVALMAGRYVQKIDTRTDSVVGAVNLSEKMPAGATTSFNVLTISDDGSKLAVTNWAADGALILVDANSMTVTQVVSGGLFNNPHGIAANSSFDTFYVTGQTGNFVYKFSMNGGFIEQISIDTNQPSYIHSRDPHEIMMSPDHSKYFLTCELSNEIRVMDTYADTLIKVIPVGIFPQEMAISKSKPYLFATCMEDNSSHAGYKGSVYVIDYNTLEIVKHVEGDFYQPHGISVDDNSGTFTIVSRNANPNGPAPHHSTACGGRAGWYNIYDLNTLESVDGKRYEVTVDPYSADTRFK